MGAVKAAVEKAAAEKVAAAKAAAATAVAEKEAAAKAAGEKMAADKAAAAKLATAEAIPAGQPSTAVEPSAEKERLLPDLAGALRLEPSQGLVPHDFTDLYQEKLAAHLAGTREWAFADIFSWLGSASAEDTVQLFWLMGGGGTGKSVLSAELLRRLLDADRVVAWHFCRHDNPHQSAPASLLRSLAAMLCTKLPGYTQALGTVSADVLTSTDAKELFDALYATPLAALAAPEEAQIIIIDALDELPKEHQKLLLDLIAGQLFRLPKWLCMFVTSREEPQIKKALSKFKPRELRADEAKNKADVEVGVAILRSNLRLTSGRRALTFWPALLRVCPSRFHAPTRRQHIFCCSRCPPQMRPLPYCR